MKHFWPRKDDAKIAQESILVLATRNYSGNFTQKHNKAKNSHSFQEGKS